MPGAVSCFEGQSPVKLEAGMAAVSDKKGGKRGLLWRVVKSCPFSWAVEAFRRQEGRTA